MKYLIIIDATFSILAMIQLCRTLFHSYVLQKKLEANTTSIIQKGLIYLLASDKIALQRLSRLIIILLITSNFILFTWSISRILNNYAAYATGWITITAIGFHFIMFLIAHFIFLIYSNANISFLNKIKI